MPVDGKSTHVDEQGDLHDTIMRRPGRYVDLAFSGSVGAMEFGPLQPFSAISVSGLIMTNARILVLLLLSGALRERLEAQHQSPLCYRPKPLARCSAFVFLDGAGALELAAGHTLGQKTYHDLSTFGGGLVGVMRNTRSDQSVGLSAEYEYGTAARGSVKAHWRKWYSNGASLDASAGPMLADIFSPGNGGDQRVRAKGATADVALVNKGGIGLFVGVDQISGAGRTTRGLHSGIRTEGWFTVGAAVAALATFTAGGWILHR